MRDDIVLTCVLLASTQFDFSFFFSLFYWDIIDCDIGKFKMCKALVWYICILQYDYSSSISWHLYHVTYFRFFSVLRTVMIYSLCCSVAVMFDSLQPHGLHHTRILCPSVSSRVCSNSCPFSWWHPPNHLILYHPLLLLPSIFPIIRIFSNESALCIRWPKFWHFSFSEWIFRVDVF